MTQPDRDAISETELHAFIDGELPEPRLSAVATAVEADPALAARIAAFERDRDMMVAAYAPVARAPLPQAWLDRIEAALDPAARGAGWRSGEATGEIGGDAPSPVVRSMPSPVVRSTLSPVVSSTLSPVVSSTLSPVMRSMPSPGARKRGAPAWRWAVAACVALLLGLGVSWRYAGLAGDRIVAEAEAARDGSMAPSLHLAGAALPAPDGQRRLLREATGLPVRAPDLRRLGWHLVSLDIYHGAAGLHYASAAGSDLSVYVRRSAGSPRFEFSKDGKNRLCVWQDEVVGAVMMGDMSAGQMMRVAGAAYADLDM